jgi:hypothetical protein
MLATVEFRIFRQVATESSTCYLLHACFFFGLFFDPDDGGDMFPQNGG